MAGAICTSAGCTAGRPSISMDATSGALSEIAR